jgi:peptidyl-dipeptidase A
MSPAPRVVIAVTVTAALALAASGIGAAPGSAGAPPAKSAAAAAPAAAPRGPRRVTATEREARAFLEVFSALHRPVATVAAEAAWAAATDVTPEHTGARAGAEKAAAALAGARMVIERSRAFLAKEKELAPLTARQLRKLLLAAAEAPGTLPEVAAERVEAEARQSAVQDGFTFCLEPRGPARCGRTATANEIDDILRRSRNLAERERAWVASKEIGRPLKAGLAALVALRNRVAREMGHASFFALQVADYDMTVEEMMSLLGATLEATRPLYDALHCLARQTLAERFRRSMPKLIPAHWIGNRWAQVWPGLVDAVSFDTLFRGRTREQIVRTAEDFYVALGFPRLPETFWKRSDLYPVDKGSARKKNAHASAWHVDSEQDVRSLMSVEPDARWFGTAHHELGHIYYYLAYARPEVPLALRAGANRAFHEAVGELARLASLQAPYLRRLGIVRAGGEPDPAAALLEAAMDSIVFLPFAAGTMSHFERDLYEAELPASEWQARWWQHAARFQGIEPPGPRPADLCDACTKTHVNDDPAQYYDYALATLIKFQLHAHICGRILKQDVRACDYGAAGADEVGKFLRGILSLGATRDWRQVMRDTTGADIGPAALVSYFAPLVDELARRNAGKDCSR